MYTPLTAEVLNARTDDVMMQLTPQILNALSPEMIRQLNQAFFDRLNLRVIAGLDDAFRDHVAEGIHLPNWSPYYGYGLPNIGRALTLLGVNLAGLTFAVPTHFNALLTQRYLGEGNALAPHLLALGFDAFFAHNIFGGGIPIAMVDYGIRQYDRHFTETRVDRADGVTITGLPSLNVGRSRVQEGTNFYEPRDGGDHGSQVATMLVAASYEYRAFGEPIRLLGGGAPDADLATIRLDTNGSLAWGIHAAIDSGARVINVSWGGYADNILARGAFERANALGVIVVIASGNEGDAGRDDLHALGYDLPNVVVVGGTNPGGSILWKGSNQAGLAGRYPYVVGPANKVWTYKANEVPYESTGTSFASPLVVAMLTNLLQVLDVSDPLPLGGDAVVWRQNHMRRAISALVQSAQGDALSLDEIRDAVDADNYNSYTVSHLLHQINISPINWGDAAYQANVYELIRQGFLGHGLNNAIVRAADEDQVDEIVTLLQDNEGALIELFNNVLTDVQLSNYVDSDIFEDKGILFFRRLEKNIWRKFSTGFIHVLMEEGNFVEFVSSEFYRLSTRYEPERDLENVFLLTAVQYAGLSTGEGAGDYFTRLFSHFLGLVDGHMVYQNIPSWFLKYLPDEFIRLVDSRVWGEGINFRAALSDAAIRERLAYYVVVRGLANISAANLSALTEFGDAPSLLDLMLTLSGNNASYLSYVGAYVTALFNAGRIVSMRRYSPRIINFMVDVLGSRLQMDSQYLYSDGSGRRYSFIDTINYSPLYSARVFNLLSAYRVNQLFRGSGFVDLNIVLPLHIRLAMSRDLYAGLVTPITAEQLMALNAEDLALITAEGLNNLAPAQIGLLTDEFFTRLSIGVVRGLNPEFRTHLSGEVSAVNRRRMAWSVYSGYGIPNLGDALAFVQGRLGNMALLPAEFQYDNAAVTRAFLASGGVLPDYLNAFNIGALWNAGLFGTGINVAIIDTGMDIANMVLMQNVDTGASAAFGDDGGTYADNGEIYDYHGTAVASMLVPPLQTVAIAGTDVLMGGGAPDATLQILRVTNSVYVADAVRFAMSRGVRIINMSYRRIQDLFSLLPLFRAGYDSGVIFTIAAGNDHQVENDFAQEVSKFNLHNVYIVGATNRAGASLTSFSDRSSSVEHTYLAVPGNQLPVYGGGSVVGRASGTSFAAPLLASGIANLLEYVLGTEDGRGMTPTQQIELVWQALVGSTRDVAPPPNPGNSAQGGGGGGGFASLPRDLSQTVDLLNQYIDNLSTESAAQTQDRTNTNSLELTPPLIAASLI
jgi:hypothetical protein